MKMMLVCDSGGSGGGDVSCGGGVRGDGIGVGGGCAMEEQLES